jgi:hypothetical protein
MDGISSRKQIINIPDFLRRLMCIATSVENIPLAIYAEVSEYGYAEGHSITNGGHANVGTWNNERLSLLD